MANTLKNLNITEVSLVPAGANQHARISLFKSKDQVVDVQKMVTSIEKADPKLFADKVREDEQWKKFWDVSNKIEEYVWNLQSSIQSIMNSDAEDKESKARESIAQFMTTLGMTVPEMATLIQKSARITKSVIVAGKELNFSANDYAYIPDITKSSTWELRLTNTPGGEPTPRVVDAAVAAIDKGFRGNKVEIPSTEIAKVKRTLRSAWLKANVNKTRDDLPEILKVNTEANMPELLDLTAIDDAVSKAIDGVAKDGDVASAVIKALEPVLKAANTAHSAIEKAHDGLKDSIEKGANDEAFTDTDGNTIKKSVVGEGTYQLLKSMNAKLAKAAENDAINKAATDAQTKYPNIAMDAVEKGSILFHSNKMPEGVQKSMEKLLVMANQNLKGITKQNGYSGPGGNEDRTPQNDLRKALQADGAIKGE